MSDASITGPFSPQLQAFIDEAPLERVSIVTFIAEAGRELGSGARVLDVGAGSAPYRELLDHTEYVVADWSLSPHAGPDSLDIVAPADDLPVEDGSFDAVVCTQVLEHVAEPGKVLKELFRVLVPGGTLYLTAPLVWEEHEMPHDYFRYTRSGLAHLATDAGFINLAITARTDSFTSIGQLLNSAKWSIGEFADEHQAERQAAFDRVEELAEEVAAFAPFDGQRKLPLGYSVKATRPAESALAERSGDDSAPSADTGPVSVLYLAPWVDLGGSDKGTIDWFKHIDRSRWKPSLITTQPSDNRWVRALEPYAEEVWNLPQIMEGADFPRFILEFIVSRKVEVVHIMNSRLGFDLLPDISVLEDPPAIVVQLHAEEPDQSGYVRYTARRYGNLIDAFSVTSEQLGQAVRGYDVPSSKVHVITTGVDGIGEFCPEHVEPFEGLRGDAPRILWPGRLVAQKDPMLTLEVLRILVDRGVKFQLDVVGDGDMADDVRARARELGVDDRICWYPPSHEMPRWYRSCDLLLMTSVFEGVPYVMYEALAMGVPVVVPAIPGNVEFLTGPDSGGVLIEPRDDAHAYADAIERLLSDDAHRRDLGRRARNRMLREFTLEEMGARHDQLYDDVLALRPRRRNKQAPAPLPVIEFPREATPEPTVAVIVPCYRHGRFLEEAIASIRAQSLQPSQIIVVDDASPDRETIEALQRVERDPAVRVLRLPTNSGPSVARNRALAEVTANYVLPLDADDALLPSAIEHMVEQLEVAPPDIGFIYPNAQHFGNRNDYYEAPAYNLHLLMQANYCPATTLFDRRIFDHGIRYPEELVRGHEDWDLVLQMAAHGIHGAPAEVPTFLYRKNGFSRITSVEFGKATEKVHDRHPELYARSTTIKAQWAPALSLLLLDPDEAASRWSDTLEPALEAQTCQDFEVVPVGAFAAAPRRELVVRTGPSDNVDASQVMEAAVRRARGRFVVVVDREGLALAQHPAFVEHVLRIFWHNYALPHFVVASVADQKIPFMAQLSAEQIRAASTVAVAWRREENQALDDLEIAGLSSALVDIAADWELDGPVQWRSA